MNIYIDKYLKEFEIFKNIHEVLNEYGIANPEEYSTDQEISSRKIYSEWADVADKVGSSEWTKDDWNNFLSCMSMAVAKKPDYSAIKYALAAVKLKVRDLTVTKPNSVKVTVYSIGDPAIKSISESLKKAIRTLIMVNNPDPDLSVVDVYITTSDLDIETENYVRLSRSVILCATNSNYTSTGSSTTEVDNYLIGRSILSIYEGSLDLKDINKDYNYISYQYRYQGEYNSYRLDSIIYDLSDLYTISETQPSKDGYIDVSSLNDTSTPINNYANEFIMNCIKDDEYAPYVIFDEASLKLWVRIKGYKRDNLFLDEITVPYTYISSDNEKVTKYVVYKLSETPRIKMEIKLITNLGSYVTKNIDICYYYNEVSGIYYPTSDTSIVEEEIGYYDD